MKWRLIKMSDILALAIIILCGINGAIYGIKYIKKSEGMI